MIWLGRAWSWLKENWQWVIFPVGLFMWWVSEFGRREELPGVVDPKLLAEAERKKEMEIAQANELRDTKLKELAEAHQERLSWLNDEQERELEDLAEKPIEEVVAWFDKL